MSAERANTLLRVVDRYAGVPMVALLGGVRRLRRRGRPADVRRVGIIRTGGIGDAVLLSGVVQDVARAGCEVHLFLGSGNAAIGGLIPGVAQVVALPLTDPLAAVRRMRALPLDLVMDTGQWPRIDALLAATARTRWTVGFRTRGQHRHLAFDATVEHSSAVHELENFRTLARAAGFVVGAAPRLERGDPVPGGLLPPRPYVVCHLWSGGYMGHRKEWPRERWIALFAHVLARGLDVVLTGGAQDRERTAAVVRSPGVEQGRVHDLSGRLTLRQVVELLRGSSAVVSVNTGIMHIAATVGARVVSLEGPVPVRRWGPLGEHATSVVSRHRGAGFLDLGWEYAGAPTDTMDGVAVADVVAALESHLRGAAA